MSDEKKSFAEWALVELMGHQRIVGYVTEQSIAGSAMLRVDVPGPDGATQYTRFYGGGAIYAINPIDRDLAIQLAGKTDAEPVKSYQLPAPPAPHDPCAWHGKQKPIEGENPVACDCGMLLNTQTCPGCSYEFLDFSGQACDDVMSPPRVTSSGDLRCMRCASRDERAETEEDEHDFEP